MSKNEGELQPPLGSSCEWLQIKKNKKIKCLGVVTLSHWHAAAERGLPCMPSLDLYSSKVTGMVQFANLAENQPAEKSFLLG